MQYSTYEREMQNSPLKCTTNGSPAKDLPGSSDLHGSPAKKEFVSPDKRAPAENKPSNSPSALRKQNSPAKKYGSPTSPSKRTKPFGKPIEIIRNKLYWVSDASPPQNIHNAFFFNIDNDLIYMPFNKDFGPLNLTMTHRFCRELSKLLQSDNFKGNSRIYHYSSSTDYTKITNAVYLMCAFMVVILKMDAHQAYAQFASYHPYLRPFRDASKGDCYYDCTILHCLEGLQEGLRLGWYDFKTFNAKEYEHYEKVENGDLNWIIPGKFLAFMGPVDKRDSVHRYGHAASAYVNIFKHLNVTKVVRLNDPKYDK